MPPPPIITKASLRSFVHNLMVLFVITILEGGFPVSEGFVSVSKLFV